MTTVVDEDRATLTHPVAVPSIRRASNGERTRARTSTQRPVPEWRETRESRDRSSSNQTSRAVGNSTGPEVATEPGLIEVKDLTDWTRLFRFPVCQTDESTLAYARSFGWPVLPTNHSFNPHAISHLARDVAMLQILSTEGKGLERLKVLDYFGSDRNSKFSPQTRGPYCRTADGRRSKEVFEIVFRNVPNISIAGDAPRLSAFRTPMTDDCDFCVIQDVYETVTPSKLLELCRRTSKGVTYLILRQFRGEAGADLLRLPDGKYKSEHVWIRDESGLINGSPDPETDPYPPHPDLAFLSQRSVDGIDITTLSNVGPYKIYKVKETAKRAIKIKQSLLLGGPVELVSIVPRSSSWADWFLGRNSVKTVLAHVPTVTKLSTRYSIRQPRGHVIDSALGSVESSLLEDTQLVQVRDRFPGFYQEVVRGTQSAVLYADREVHITRLYDLRAHNRELETTLDQVRGLVAPVPEKNFPWFRYLLAFVSLLLCFEWFPIPMAILTVREYTPLKLFLSVILEELVRAYCPALMFSSLITAELLLNFHFRGWVYAVSVLVGHSVTGTLVWLPYGYFWAFCFHAFNNYCCWALLEAWWQRLPDSRYYTFYNSYIAGGRVTEHRDFESFWTPIPGGSAYPSLQTAMDRVLPEGFRGHMEVFLDGQPVHPDAALAAVKNDDTLSALSADGMLRRLTVHAIAVTNGMMWAPENSDANLLVAIGQRLHADPFQGIASKFSSAEVAAAERRLVWKTLAKQMLAAGFFNSTIERVPTLEECCFLMGSKKGKRLLAADLEQRMGLGRDRHSKTVFVKTNETIHLKHFPGGLKPRAITNLDAAVHAAQAPWSRAVANVLHKDLHVSRMYEMAGIVFRVVFASGYSPKQLEDAVQMALMIGDTVFFVSGDDTFVCWGPLYGMYKSVTSPFGEADLSKADHSQDEGPLVEFTRLIQQAWELPQDYIGLREWSCAAPYTAKGKRIFVKGSTAMQLPTGTTDTTTLNSTTSAAMCCHFIRTGQNRSFEECSAELGLTSKFVASEILEDATFLKGWFIPHVYGFEYRLYHLPLPSCILKMGKVMTNPQLITKERGKRKDSSLIAIRKVAYSIALGYTKVPPNYPLVGAFVRMLFRCGIPSNLVGVSESYYPDKWAGDQAVVDRQQVLVSTMKRYRLLQSDIERVERLLDSVESLPAYIEDRVFDVLREVDY
jgi:hypothetical protein